jgi:hypothetical protein
VTTRTLQRCACGGHAPPGGECAQCRAKRVATESVSRTLSAPGRPLDAGVRASFERQWAHDFSRVRIHDDATAAGSAKAVGARAYTVGDDVAFAHGQYDPASGRGRALLAHELTHVRQQAGAPSSGPVTLLDHPAAEREADRAPAAVTQRVPGALQRQPDDEPAPAEAPAPTSAEGEPETDQPTPGAPVQLEGVEEAGEGEGEEELGVLAQAPVPMQAPPPAPAPAACEPDRSLTWADFTGRPPRRPRFGAETHMRTPTTGAGAARRFRAVLNGGASWVLPKFPGAAARATNGCAPRVAACQRAFARRRLANWSWNPAGCPAAIATATNATSAAECETVVGATCDSDATQESDRLLAHEQGHFDIACVLVKRANDALDAGMSFARVNRWLTRNHGRLQGRYDAQTNHGCNAGPQAAWEGDIAGDLRTRVAGP